MKKKIIFLLSIVVLFSQSLYAGSDDYKKLSAKSSWETIEKTQDILIRYPSVPAEGVLVSVKNLCIDGNMFKGKKEYERCVKWDMSHGENIPKCLKTETARVVTPRQHTKTSCLEHQEIGDGAAICVSEKSDKVLYPTTVQADVYLKLQKGDNRKVKFLFKKDYDLPKCN